MKFFYKKKNYLLIVPIFLFILKLKIFNNSELQYEKIFPKCSCHQDLFILKKSDRSYIIKIGKKIYETNSKSNLTCELYKSLKRGPYQKIVSYSLYGKNIFYYKLIMNLTRIIREFYPDHVMRIYHDNSIDQSIICKIECSNDHVEFCSIHSVPNSIQNRQNVLDMNYIHSMMWRFLPIGDTFVDYFMSRDLDSLILKREFDSVREWLSSDKIGHIMRGK